jgi:hypothetical protein
MIKTCNRCFSDFLTEADPYITQPIGGDYVFTCTCIIQSLELQVKELETALEIWHELMREKNKEIAMSDEVNRGLANRNHDLKMMIEAPENDNDIVDKLEHRIYDLKKERSEMKEALIDFDKHVKDTSRAFSILQHSDDPDVKHAKLIEKLNGE